ELEAKFPNSRVNAASKRLREQMEVVGKSITSLQIDEWYQGETSLADGKATLLVFWEVWCPHCKREVPKLQATYEKFKGEGLNVIGLTKLTRGKTADEAKSFISEQNVGYPM